MRLGVALLGLLLMGLAYKTWRSNPKWGQRMDGGSPMERADFARARMDRLLAPVMFLFGLACVLFPFF